MTVKKVKGGYKVLSSTKGYLSKKPKTLSEARKQHFAVQVSKGEIPGVKPRKKRKKL